MLRRSRCCLILLSAFGPGALSWAQEKPGTPAPVAQQAPQDAALQALVEQYLAAYAKKDLNAMMALWSPNSPELNRRRKELETYFAENDKIAFAHVEIHPASGRGEKVRLRVSVEISAVDAKTGTGRPSPLSGLSSGFPECFSRVSEPTRSRSRSLVSASILFLPFRAFLLAHTRCHAPGVTPKGLKREYVRVLGSGRTRRPSSDREL